LEVLVSEDFRSFYKLLPEKDQRIIREHLDRLKDYPDIHGDVKPLHGGQGVLTFRMHIGRRYTLFFRVDSRKQVILVLMLMTIEKSHKKYGEYLNE
jgi:mRNA interferase RelE/StbE